MQLRVLPVGKATVAPERWAAEMEDHVVVLEHLDVAPDDEMLALRAETEFIQGPPLLEGIVLLEELQLPPFRDWQVTHTPRIRCTGAAPVQIEKPCGGL